MPLRRLLVLVLFLYAAFAAPARADDASVVVDVTTNPLTPANAPADEYFGTFKLSNLGIRNIIRAFRIEGNSPLALPLQRARMAAVDTAIVQWADEYPRDSWLVGVTFGFADVLMMKRDPATDVVAIDLLLQASQRYRNTKYEKMALDRMRAIHPASGVDLTVDVFDPPSLTDLATLNTNGRR